MAQSAADTAKSETQSLTQLAQPAANGGIVDANGDLTISSGQTVSIGTVLGILTNIGPGGTYTSITIDPGATLTVNDGGTFDAFDAAPRDSFDFVGDLAGD